MSTKVFFYTLRPFDEQAIVKDLAQQWGVEYGYTEAYPTLENAQLAAGYDAVSLTPCDMSAPMVQRFHDLGSRPSAAVPSATTMWTWKRPGSWV